MISTQHEKWILQATAIFIAESVSTHKAVRNHLIFWFLMRSSLNACSHIEKNLYFGINLNLIIFQHLQQGRKPLMWERLKFTQRFAWVNKTKVGFYISTLCLCKGSVQKKSGLLPHTHTGAPCCRWQLWHGIYQREKQHVLGSSHIITQNVLWGTYMYKTKITNWGHIYIHIHILWTYGAQHI